MLHVETTEENKTRASPIVTVVDSPLGTRKMHKTWK